MWWIGLALVLLAIVYFRPKALWAVLGLAVILLAAVLVYDHRQDVLRTKVSVDVVYAPALCSKERPLRVSIKNGSERVLHRAAFSFQATLPGYSTKITPYTYKQNTSDKILRPGEVYESCYSLPLLSRELGPEYDLEVLQWSAEVTRTDFE